MNSVYSDHEYEPVGAALIPRTLAPTIAPVVRIDTDVVPVADSDDSIDVKGRFTPGPMLDGDDVVLPLDGQIEDKAMEARELGSGDTSDDLELETAQQMQDRIEERFLNTATPGTESRTDGEVNTSQVGCLSFIISLNSDFPKSGCLLALIRSFTNKIDLIFFSLDLHLDMNSIFINTFDDS